MYMSMGLRDILIVETLRGVDPGRLAQINKRSDIERYDGVPKQRSQWFLEQVASTSCSYMLFSSFRII